MNRSEWEYLNQLEDDRYHRYGETPRWLEADEELALEEAAFEKECRYFDAPLPFPVRESDDWLEEAA